MDATRYFALARKWWWLLVLGMVLAAGGYAAATRAGNASQTGFRASTTLLVVSRTEGPEIPGVESYAEMIEGRPVMEQTIANLGLSDSVEALRDRVQSQVLPDTQLIRVLASGASAEEAQLLAIGVARAFDSLHETQGLPGSVSIYEYEPARAFQGTAGSGLGGGPLGVALAALFGVIVAGGTVLLIDYFGEPVATARDASEATGLPVLATIPAWPAKPDLDRCLVVDKEDANGAFERYRMLRTSFALRTSDEPASTVQLVAGLAGEGATTTAANFATVLARSGRRVALVDANLQSPSLHEAFGLPNERGLTQALVGDPAEASALLQSAGFNGLAVMTSGPAPKDSSELLESDGFDRLLATLKADFDTVVLDSPPALATTDAAVLAARADATIIVLRAHRTTREQGKAAIEALASASPRLLGAVLNGELPRPRIRLPHLRVRKAVTHRNQVVEPELQPAERSAG